MVVTYGCSANMECVLYTMHTLDCTMMMPGDLLEVVKFPVVVWYGDCRVLSLRRLGELGHGDVIIFFEFRQGNYAFALSKFGMCNVMCDSKSVKVVIHETG
jgi:hypothetical protein